jgi:hypothetical protein
MSFLKTAIAAGAISMAMLSGASAQNPEPWTLSERNAYILMMNGQTMQVRLNDATMSALMKRAKRVPRGTVLIMSGGNLYTVNASKMTFDRAGNWMAMGGGG